MSYWNYRIIYHPPSKIGNVEVEEYYGIYEVHYNDNGVSHSCTVDSIIVGNTIDELKRVLEYIELALNKKILNFEEFEKNVESEK